MSKLIPQHSPQKPHGCDGTVRLWTPQVGSETRLPRASHNAHCVCFQWALSESHQLADSLLCGELSEESGSYYQRADESKIPNQVRQISTSDALMWWESRG